MSSRSKKKVARFVLIAVALSAFIVLGSVIYQWLKYRKAKFTHYPEFGISIPTDYTIHGIDVSKYQNVIAWEEVRAMNIRNISLGFAYIKATEGISNADPQFRRNWKKAADAGMLKGAYHFFIGSKDGKMQAENFINRVTLEKGDLPPVLDIEQLNGATSIELRREAKRFLDVVEEYYHTKPVIYTNVDFYNRVLGSEFDGYPLWVAHYYQTRQPRIKRGWVMWQHSDEGRVNGILTKVDFNVFNGDSTTFSNFLVK
jgi:lysozyme